MATALDQHELNLLTGARKHFRVRDALLNRHHGILGAVDEQHRSERASLCREMDWIGAQRQVGDLSGSLPPPSRSWTASSSSICWRFVGA